MVQPRPLFKTIFTSFLNWRRSALSEIAKVMAAKQKGGGGRGGGDTSGWGVAGKEELI